VTTIQLMMTSLFRGLLEAMMTTQVQKLADRVKALESITEQQGKLIALFMSDDFIENIKNSIESAFSSFDIVEAPTSEISTQTMTEALKKHIEQHQEK